MDELHPFVLDERFRKVERLTRRCQFLDTQRQGARHVTQHFVVYARLGAEPFSRVGLTVSRKVGNAVVRNLVKRRLREVFRRNKRQLPTGYDFVWIARKGAGEASFESLDHQIKEAAHRAARKNRQQTRPKGEEHKP